MGTFSYKKKRELKPRDALSVRSAPGHRPPGPFSAIILVECDNEKPVPASELRAFPLAWSYCVVHLLFYFFPDCRPIDDADPGASGVTGIRDSAGSASGRGSSAGTLNTPGPFWDLYLLAFLPPQYVSPDVCDGVQCSSELTRNGDQGIP